MTGISCKEVNIRFKSVNLHQQRLRYSDYSGASNLRVSTNSEFIIVEYVHQLLNNILKVIIFNKDEVVEIECEDSVKIEPEIVRV